MRADRLIAIIMHLQQFGRATAKELAERLEVSERTIYRDIDALSGLGVPVEAEAGLGGGFALPANYRTKVDGLHTPEIHALFLHMNEQPFKQLGIDKPMRSALLKLLGSLPAQQREDADWIRDRVLIDPGSWRRQPGHEDRLQLLRQAVWEQRRAEIVYTDRTQTTSAIALDSYGLVLKAGMWFVAGKALNGIRAFRLAKIKAVRLGEEVFERPGDFKLTSFWSDWMADYELRQFPYDVTARMDEEALTRVSKWGGVLLETSAAGDGRLIAKLGFENEDAALSAMLGLAGSAQVDAPLELRRRMREEAGRLLEAYEEG